MNYFLSKQYLLIFLFLFLIVSPLTGQKLYQSKNTTKNIKQEQKTSIKPAEKDIIHIVQPGECLWSIAAKYYRDYNVSAAKLRQYNHLQNTHLHPGMKIRIPRDKWQIPAKIVGLASWYGDPNMVRDYFHGKKTASGEIYNTFALTAAHKSLPLGTVVKVVNPRNGLSVVVRINDRGPYIAHREIDLSYQAAQKLGIAGVEKVVIYPLSNK